VPVSAIWWLDGSRIYFQTLMWVVKLNKNPATTEARPQSKRMFGTLRILDFCLRLMAKDLVFTCVVVLLLGQFINLFNSS
jgi:hypothetical protein